MKFVVLSSNKKKPRNKNVVKIAVADGNLETGIESKKAAHNPNELEPCPNRTPLTRSNSSENQTQKIAVIGAGAFGTAMATLAALNGYDVYLYARDFDQVNTINQKRHNPKCVSEFTLSENITAVNSAVDAVSNATVIILALPAQIVSWWLEENKAYIDVKTVICNTAKGLYLKEGKLLSQAVREALGREQPYVVLSGPSFAKEIMASTPTAVVAASTQTRYAEVVQRALSSSSFMVFKSEDVVGVEMGGALKNPLAIGAGVLQGLGLGCNALSSYVTLSCMELQQLCAAMGGQPGTLSGLAGIGDLMLTAFGDLSRNRSLGLRLCRGELLQDILASMTVEGVPTARVAVRLADQFGLKVPIFRSIQALLMAQIPVKDAPLYLFGQRAPPLPPPNSATTPTPTSVPGHSI